MTCRGVRIGRLAAGSACPVGMDGLAGGGEMAMTDSEAGAGADEAFAKSMTATEGSSAGFSSAVRDASTWSSTSSIASALGDRCIWFSQVSAASWLADAITDAAVLAGGFVAAPGRSASGFCWFSCSCSSSACTCVGVFHSPPLQFHTPLAGGRGRVSH